MLYDDPMTETKYDLAVTFGRFNLLHIGHLDMFDQMSNLADECLIGVSDGPKNLPTLDRIDVIHTALGLDDILSKYHRQVDTSKASNPFAFFDYITAERVVLVLGEDQLELAKAAKKAFGWDYHLVKRLCSSTEVRALIDNEDWGRLADVVPSSIISDIIRLRGLEILSKGK